MNEEELKALATPLNDWWMEDKRGFCWRSKEQRKAFLAAHIIWGYNTANDNLTLFYGRKRLEKIKATGNSQELSLIVISYDGDVESDDLEKLVALCNKFRGHCDYKSWEEAVDELADKLFNG